MCVVTEALTGRSVERLGSGEQEQGLDRGGQWRLVLLCMQAWEKSGRPSWSWCFSLWALEVFCAEELAT